MYSPQKGFNIEFHWHKNICIIFSIQLEHFSGVFFFLLDLLLFYFFKVNLRLFYFIFQRYEKLAKAQLKKVTKLYAQEKKKSEDRDKKEVTCSCHQYISNYC